MRPSKTHIANLRKGIIPFIMQGTPFVIIHEIVRMNLTQETAWEWTIVASLDDKEHVTISRDEALEIIRNNKMTVCHTQKEGQIYELPGEPFYKMYNWKSRQVS